ncbi:putative hscarg dehydrogenase [Lasiosphaeria ovina]|uniref:Hscarg dehydrogenase n=1 Tax=Lasiosphaeria ovina TaxID=92902 RepID=A0AAE0NJD4_9PEZI|nr:putative hscarg dehydrogenase [Lasiosphaeria ovina]
MSKILAVFGATGQQGSSVVDHVLGDAELSREYKLRAIVRNVDSEKAKQLTAKGVEVVQGDTSDRASLEAALTGAHTVYIMTVVDFTPGVDDYTQEYNTAKTIADVSVAKGAAYLIFSTLPSPRAISGGKYTAVSAFDVKADAEQYIRSLSPKVQSAFVSLGSFMENWVAPGMLAPHPSADGSHYVLTRNQSAASLFPLIDAVGDVGKFVGAILAEPAKYDGVRLHAAQALYSFAEITVLMSKSAGKKIVVDYVSTDEFRKSLPISGPVAEIFIEGFAYMDEFGYFGPETAKLVAADAPKARGRLATFEEYLERHPVRL